VAAIKAALLEFPPGSTVLESDYPQEMRTVEEHRALIDSIRESDAGATVVDGILAAGCLAHSSHQDLWLEIV
jgi:hypothetical protein